MTTAAPASATWLLVADDDPDLREALADALRACGFDVKVAPDGARALRAIEDADSLPALVLLDLLMPWVTGRDVLLAMRSAERTRRVPVLVLTGVDVDGWGLPDLGVAEVVRKPVGFEELLAAVRRVAGESPSGEGTGR